MILNGVGGSESSSSIGVGLTGSMLFGGVSGSVTGDSTGGGATDYDDQVNLHISVDLPKPNLE